MILFRWRLIVNFISFITGNILIWTGAMMWFVLPPGNHNSSVWTMTRHDWGNIHEIAAVIMVIVITLHVLLNWTMLMGMLRKLFHTPTSRQQQLWGICSIVLFLAMMIGSLLIADKMKVVHSEGRGRRRAVQSRALLQIHLAETIKEQYAMLSFQSSP